MLRDNSFTGSGGSRSPLFLRNKVCAGLLVIAVMFAGCDARMVKQRAILIRERNAQNDRESSAIAVRKVREQWLVRDGKWFGKLSDGTLVRLDSLRISSTAIKKGRPYCCKWLGEVTISSGHWWTTSAEDTSLPYSLTYTVLVRDSSRIDFVDTAGVAVIQPSQVEIAGLEALP